MEHTHGESETHAEGGKVHSELNLRTGGAPHDESTIGVLGGILRGAATDALYTSTSKVRDALRSIDERTRIFSVARDRPLTILGAAFGTGLLLALVTEPKEGNRHVERLRRRLKATIISGVVAAIASTTPAISGPGGMIDELGNWLEGDEDADEIALNDYEDEDEPEYD